MTDIEKILQELYEYTYMKAVHDEREDGLEMSNKMTVEKAAQAINKTIMEKLDKLASEMSYQNPHDQKIAEHVFTKVRNRLSITKKYGRADNE